MITFVQLALLLGALCGGGLAFDLLEKGQSLGGFASGFLAVVGLAGVVVIEITLKR